MKNVTCPPHATASGPKLQSANCRVASSATRNVAVIAGPNAADDARAQHRQYEWKQRGLRPHDRCQRDTQREDCEHEKNRGAIPNYDAIRMKQRTNC